jgi:L-gulonate 5-dehydrogenase
MRAAIFDEPLKIRMAEKPRPSAKAGEVLIRVSAVGLCAGDLYIYMGKNPYVTFPRVGGHEVAGIVEELGQGVSGIAPGALATAILVV